MDRGVRPNKLWHWGAIAFIAATFLAEPKAAFALTWDIFRGAGAVGGEIITGGSDDERDVLRLEEDPPFADLFKDNTPPLENGPDGDLPPDPPLSRAAPGGEIPQAAPEPEGASFPNGCGPDDSCVYGFPLPDQDVVIAEAERLHEMTNGALGCLMDDRSTDCLSTETTDWLPGVTDDPPRTTGGGSDENGRWIPVVIEPDPVVST